jgi:hypothetical protein
MEPDLCESGGYRTPGNLQDGIPDPHRARLHGSHDGTNLLFTDGATPVYFELYQPDVSACLEQVQILLNMAFDLPTPTPTVTP